VRALVVDDTVAVREWIAEALELLGVEVQVASSLLEAVARLDASHAFALVDMKLPDGCGLDLVPHAADLGVSVIAMSGDPDSVTDVGEAHGVSDVLAKPFDLAVLRSIVSRY